VHLISDRFVREVSTLFNSEQRRSVSPVTIGHMLKSHSVPALTIVVPTLEALHEELARLAKKLTREARARADALKPYKPKHARNSRVR
jgi:hypothetical protein